MNRLATFALLLAVASTATAEEADKKGLEFFEKHIRPVLVTQCYECHSVRSKEAKGKLLLDTRMGIRHGGESGPAVVPGDVDGSLLMEALRYESFEMPPAKQLPASVVADFAKWIEMGAPDPRDGKSALVRREIDIEEGRRFWAFQPVTAPEVPTDDTGWSRSDVDRFVHAKHAENGVEPVADATPTALVRRVYLDLVGLPPTPAQQDEYLNDPTPEKFAEIVDRLLASPRFGERWGRHWLDVVRYAESTGMERNFTYPHAWRYRDYVVDAFNADKPFDEFVREQIAGDLLPADSLEERTERITATGLLALGPKSLNERNREQFVMDVADEQIDVTTRAFLGVTVACARCHDHKFDPFPQRDYYALAGVFTSTNTFYGTGGGNGNRQVGQLLAVSAEGVSTVRTNGGGNGGKNKRAALAKQLKKARTRLETAKKQSAKNPGNKSIQKRLEVAETQVARLETQLAKVRRQERQAAGAEETGTKPVVLMGVRDGQPGDTTLRIRGEIDDRGDSVPRRFPQVVTRGHEPIGEGSGRLEYANWIVADDNPLTARVAANRIWSHLFGAGIVETVDNFGVNGGRPANAELLEHLAVRFRENGWSTKSTIREIVTSRTYQLAVAESVSASEVDPDNRLVWRANHRRLEAEVIRDATLQAAGTIDLEPAEASPVARVGDGNVGRGIDADRFATNSTKRSVYLPIVRNAVPESLAVFDFPEPSNISGRREVTTVPTQALYMLNSPFVLQQSSAMARRLLAEEMEDAERVELAYRLTVGRLPGTSERDRGLEFVALAAKGEMDRETAFAGLCQALIASAEFRYVE